MKIIAITSVEIKEKSITVAINKNVKDTPISVFNQTVFFDSTLLDANGIVVEASLIKKTLTKIFAKTNSIIWNADEVREVVCIVPSASHLEFSIKRDLNLGGQKTLFNDEIIKKFNVNAEKDQRNNAVGELINIEFEQTLVDNFQWQENKDIIGSNLTFIYKYETIDKAVYKSHTSILKNLNKNVIQVVPNMKALHNIKENLIKKPDSNVIVNWEKNKIEVAIFKNNSIKAYKTLGIGLKKIIEKTAKKFNVSDELCEKYLFENIDLNSTNALKNLVLKFNSLKSKTHLNGEQIRKEFIKQIDDVLKKALFLLSSTDSKMYSYPIFHYGIVTTIPNISKFFKTRTSTNNYFSCVNLIGSLNDYILATSIGVLNAIGSVVRNDSIVTKLNTVKNTNNLEFDFLSLGSENQYAHALFLKENGIIIDKVSPKEGK